MRAVQERAGFARVLSASSNSSMYSDEREVLDAECDYCQPRVAIHLGAKLL